MSFYAQDLAAVTASSAAAAAAATAAQVAATAAVNRFAGLTLKAWVKFRGDTGAIEASGGPLGVTSVTRTGVGVYAIVLTAGVTSAKPTFDVALDPNAGNSTTETGYYHNIISSTQFTFSCFKETFATQALGAVDVQSMYVGIYE